MKITKIGIAALLLAGSFKSVAQTDTTKSTEDNGTFTFSGYLDSYYFFNFNNPQNGSNTGASGAARAFDQKANQFQLGLVQTKIGYTNKNSEAVLDLTFGPNADLGNYGNKIGPFGAGVGTTALAIKQAYFSYNATDKLKFTAGQFGTHIGYEVIDAPINFNYSLSNLFNNGPFYHIGLKSEYTFNDKVKAMVGVVNNWDNLYDNNKFKTAIAQIALTPKEGVAIYVNYIGGNESGVTNFNDEDTLKNFKQMVDLTATFQLTEKLLVGTNIAQGFSSDKNNTKYWGGAALYSNYAFDESFGLGVRAEFFDNTQGVQYIGATNVQSYTLTGNFTLADGHLLLKPELRFDSYSKRGEGNEQFMNDKGVYNNNSQTTLGLAMIYKW
jgi:hypothetical protein